MLTGLMLMPMLVAWLRADVDPVTAGGGLDSMRLSHAWLKCGLHELIGVCDVSEVVLAQLRDWMTEWSGSGRQIAAQNNPH